MLARQQVFEEGSSPIVRPTLTATALLVLHLFLSACASRTTGPQNAATVHRTVTFTLTDSLGAPEAGVTIWVTALFDSAGFGQFMSVDTDASGNAWVVLAEGPWAASAKEFGLPGRTAGSTFVVPGATRPLADTIAARLRFVTASTASGTVTLQGRSDHRDTIISLEGPFTFAVTDSLGHWSLEGLPPGTWTLGAYHPGFRLGVAPLTVPSPGSDVAAGSMVLRP
jgi:hypothetical protein